MKKSEIKRLLIELKSEISDDYRCSGDEENTLDGEKTLAGMDVTIACNDLKSNEWGWQTGDNSFSGGAYCFHNWAVVNLYRRSNCTELAQDIIDQLADLES